MTSNQSMESERQTGKAVASGRVARTSIATAVTLALVAGGTIMVRAEAPAVSLHSATGQPMALPSFADVAERVSPAVVNVKVSSEVTTGNVVLRGLPGMPENMPLPEFFRRYFDERAQVAPHRIQGQGSGFLVDPNGYIVTNNHVIDGATEVTVVLNDGSSHSAKVVGRDDKTDLALLKIATDQPLAYVELGDSAKARVGDWVLAAGNPFGLGGSVNAGIISARGRDIHSGPYDDYLQIDAAINRGNSGGPLFDTSGRVIGVNTAIYSPTGGNVGIGFAIPAETVSHVIADLRENGHVERGWLGIQIQSVTEGLAAGLGLDEARGVLVVDVLPGGPASATDLQAGDVILSAGGQRIENAKDLPRLVADLKSGSQMELDVMRDGKPRRIDVKVGAMPDDDRVASASRSGDQSSENPHLGLYLAPLTPELRMRRGLDDGSSGVLVARVEPGSPAAEAGIEPGSLISMVGADPVRSPEQVQAAVRRASAEKQKAVIMRVERDGRAWFVAVPLSA